MKQYRIGAHTKHDLKVHLIWVPKYRKRILEGEVAIRVRDLLRQIAMEHELHNSIGEGIKRPYSRVDFVSTAPKDKSDCAMVKGDKFADIAPGIRAFEEAMLGTTSVGTRVSGSEHGSNHRRNDTEIHRATRWRAGSG